jgi:5-dehydro-4-deoxyglucarate dehydratase
MSVQDLDRFLGEFFHPFVRLRNRVPGYAVSLIKAGVRLRVLAAGGVRPPLVDPTPRHLAELARIIDTGLAVVAEAAVR